MYYKHYIVTNGSNEITDWFSTAFKQPIGGEIELRETFERQFYIEVSGIKTVNPTLIDYVDHTSLLYKWNTSSEIVEDNV